MILELQDFYFDASNMVEMLMDEHNTTSVEKLYKLMRKAYRPMGAHELIDMDIVEIWRDEVLESRYENEEV